jgi:hypothetical protein
MLRPQCKYQFHTTLPTSNLNTRRITQNHGGLSSGSAVAVAAGFAPISIGTETMGSLMVSSDRAALFTIKPTIKLILQDDIIPITHEADSAGSMTKLVQDLADLLDVLIDPNQTTVPKGGCRSAVTGSRGNIRIGFLEFEKWLLPAKMRCGRVLVHVINAITWYVRRRIFFATDKGQVGVTYHPDDNGIRLGDDVVSLFNIEAPFVLRPAPSNTLYMMQNVTHVVGHTWRHSWETKGPWTVVNEVLKPEKYTII